MATKKKNSAKKPAKKTTKILYVVRYSPNDEVHDSPVYWTDEGHGFNESIESATRFTKKDGLLKLGELLHEECCACDLVDVTSPYVSPIGIGLVAIRNSTNGSTPFMVTGVPKYRGDALTLFGGSSGTLRVTIRDFLEDLQEENFEVIWDPARSMIPEDNEEFLESHGFLGSEGNVRE